MKKIFKYIGIFLAIVALGGLIAYNIYNEDEPEGKTGAEVEVMKQKMYDAIDKVAWDSTAWVQWDFAGRNQYLWDRKNNRVRVTSGNVISILNTHDQSGTATKDGVTLKGTELDEAMKKAWSNFCNDSFWLNAPAKASDPGTRCSIVDLEDGKKGLKVEYTNGGVTPGDIYVWELDTNGLPVNYKMWVEIIPVGGMGSTWEKYISLPTGAKISTFHKIAGQELIISDVDGGMDIPNF